MLCVAERPWSERPADQPRLEMLVAVAVKSCHHKVEAEGTSAGLWRRFISSDLTLRSIAFVTPRKKGLPESRRYEKGRNCSRQARSMDVASPFRALDTNSTLLLTPLTHAERGQLRKPVDCVIKEIERRNEPPIG